jgi:hypothetical protein
MSPQLSQILFILANALIIVLMVVWWLRQTTRGLEAVAVLLILSIGIRYLSSLIFRVPPYQVGCDGLCTGWLGHPFPTHHVEAGGQTVFDPLSFVRNTVFYYAIVLAYGAFVTWLAQTFHWSARRWKQRLLFIFVVIILPLASTPMWLPPPQPRVSGEDQRIAINAARSWRWQLHERSFMDRRLALEDMRTSPESDNQRVCFRIYTWFYLPYRHTYIDMEPEGVRAVDGAEIPLSESCWTQ